MVEDGQRKPPGESRPQPPVGVSQHRGCDPNAGAGGVVDIKRERAQQDAGQTVLARPCREQHAQHDRGAICRAPQLTCGRTRHRRSGDRIAKLLRHAELLR